MRTRSKKSPEQMLWELYEKSDSDTRKEVAVDLIAQSDNCRNLKDLLAFMYHASNLDILSVVVEVWCAKHQDKLETYGLGEIWRIVRPKCTTIQVIVLAYFIQAVGRSAFLGSIDVVRVWQQAPMREVGAKLDRMGFEYQPDVVIEAKPVPQIEPPRRNLWRIRR